MTVRILPNDLINQIAAGEVVERPASVVKELVENALDAGADQIVIDVTDGGRTLINIVDNGSGMSREDLAKCVMRHATSKLLSDDLLNISTMGFRGEALPSIASVSDMTVDTCRNGDGEYGLSLDCATGEIKPSSWDAGTRVRVENLFSKTPARLKFLRSDRAEMMSVVETVKRLALARPDVGFILNNKWRFPKGQPLIDRVVAVAGEDVRGRMLSVECGVSSSELNDGMNNSTLNTPHSTLKLTGFISEPTLRRASSIDQYLFVNGRPVKDKVLVGALRAGYLDVMSAREFPIAALYLELPAREVDVNVSPAKTEVHFLEPARIRSFIIRTIRDALAVPLNGAIPENSAAVPQNLSANVWVSGNTPMGGFSDAPAFFPNFGPMTSQPGITHYVREPVVNSGLANGMSDIRTDGNPPKTQDIASLQTRPLGKVVGQIGNKYIIAENASGLVIVDQHAAHERITYEHLRAHELKRQPLLVPLVVKLKPEEVSAIAEVSAELADCGLKVEEFGTDAVAIYEKPADWDMDWAVLLRDMAAEVLANGNSSRLHEKMHLKLANHACHHSLRAGQRLDYAQMDALLRDIESTERAGQCNHGRPVYKTIPIAELDGWFER